MFATARKLVPSFFVLALVANYAQASTILNTSGDLRFTDPRDAQNKHYHVHSVFLHAGRSYVISMNSQHFDTFLRLRNPSGLTIRQNDDSGPGMNARITITPTFTGTYRIVATSYNPSATGHYTLRVDQFGNGGGGGGGVGSIVVLQTHNDLNFNDPRVNGKHQKVFTVFLHAGRNYDVNMSSQHFDTFLKVQKNGLTLRQNDDGGPGLNSRITFRPLISGHYQIVATSFAPNATGHFHLRVTQ